MQPREPGPVLRGDLEGWGGREEIYVYIQLIHMVVQQKLTQLCEAIILPPPKKKFAVYGWTQSHLLQGAFPTSQS